MRAGFEPTHGGWFCRNKLQLVSFYAMIGLQTQEGQIFPMPMLRAPHARSLGQKGERPKYVELHLAGRIRHYQRIGLVHYRLDVRQNLRPKV